MVGDVKKIVEAAGWYEGRYIDVGYMLEDLQERGFKITNPNVVELLKQFWNLNLEFQTPGGRFSNVRLNIDEASDFSSRDLTRLSELLNDDLFPVGSIHEASAILLISGSEKFYMITENKCYKIADSFFEALGVIIHERDLLRIA